MPEQTYTKCTKCGCDKVANNAKLCKTCQQKNEAFWDKVKVVGGLVGSLFITALLGRKNKLK